MQSFFSDDDDDDDDDVDISANSPSGSEAAVALASAMAAASGPPVDARPPASADPSPRPSQSDADSNADSPSGSEASVGLKRALDVAPGPPVDAKPPASADSSPRPSQAHVDSNADSPSGSEASVGLKRALDVAPGPPVDAKPRAPADASPSLRKLPSQTKLVPMAKQPGRLLTRQNCKAFTILSDDESSGEDAGSADVEELVRSNTELQKQSHQLLEEVDKWKGQANSLEGQLEELQERLEESEQSWSHEQHRRKSQWADERASLEDENAQLQRTLVEWMPMQHEDERSHLLREVLETVSRTREALGSQGSELVSYSERILEENSKLEDLAQGQAKCLEEQQHTVERLCTEVQQLDSEAQLLREAEHRAQAECAALESHASKDVISELECQHEALQHSSAQHELELQSHFNKAEAECEALAQSLQDESDSMRLELQAMDVLLQEKAKCHDLHSTCQRLEEELSEYKGADGQRHGHLETSCLRLEEELSECRKAEVSELGRIEDIRHELEEQLAEHQHSSGAECRSLAESCRQLEEELLHCQHSERSESQRQEGMCQLLEGARQKLLDEVAESRHLESQELQRLQGVCSNLEEELRTAAEAEDSSGAEAAESQRTIAQLRAQLATHEAECAVAPDRHPEEWQELEGRCAALEEEVQRLHEQLRERDEEGLRQQVKDLQRHCGDLEARCLAHQAESEWLRAEVERLTLQAEAAAKTPRDEEPNEQLHAMRSELAEAQELGRCLREGEAAHAEHRKRAEEHAEHAKQQLQAAEGRALALDEELRRARAQQVPSKADTTKACPPVPAPGKKSLLSRHRRMVGLAHGSATAVGKLLKDVCGINDARALLSSGGLDKPSAAERLGAVEELERQTSCLERNNRDWASAVAKPASDTSEAPGEWLDSSMHLGASPDWCDYAADGRRKQGMTPVERRAALTTALQHMARRLESLHGRLQEFGPSDDQDP
mmetsp:Transcript_97814/g.237887  ORF Transcript_97814/g.237887 Transcript_97814/m.237887 type:complete len:961 (+) Transcript_97814:96-2978(+)